MARGEIERQETSARIWVLQCGPCWCGSTPTEESTFDYLRFRKTVTDLGPQIENLVIVSERVIDGTAPTLRQVYEDAPEPKLVISAGPCPLASQFCDALPNGWDKVDGTAPTLRQVYEDAPEPKLVISAGPCPLASQFCDALPNGWDKVDEVLPVDIHVEDGASPVYADTVRSSYLVGLV